MGNCSDTITAHGVTSSGAAHNGSAMPSSSWCAFRVLVTIDAVANDRYHRRR